MSARDLYSNLYPTVGLAPVVVSDNTAQNTVIVDMKGYDSAVFYIQTGAIVDADVTFAVTATHGDAVDNEATPTTITDSAAVDATALQGSLAGAGFTFADDNAVKRVGYFPAKGGGKRFVRLTITPTGNAAAAPLAVLVLRRPLMAPVA